MWSCIKEGRRENMRDGEQYGRGERYVNNNIGDHVLVIMRISGRL